MMKFVCDLHESLTFTLWDYQDPVATSLEFGDKNDSIASIKKIKKSGLPKILN